MNVGDMAKKAKDFAGEHKDQVDKGVDKAGDFAKDKFGASGDQVDKGVDKAKDLLGGDRQQDDRQQDADQQR
ncbi:antitoxin [Kibdelosporangium phytohabitans]|uniref:Kanamycin biosynthetic protein n=1 Tax=Kibdelosporangium phytohabitans TaxID=860235 RepID=A0A0N9I3G8_9PSEU|nr:antitoxin [Kibdelosporangium phytohabitans]ALG10194.1 hypothetical protein AOZ06_27825 [Kibdelosporangium phytohabitans]MBE1461208.1 hypothetical protein [Kibdelosporangium phytohabitans]